MSVINVGPAIHATWQVESLALVCIEGVADAAGVVE